MANWADRLAKLAQSLSTGGVVPDANIDAAIARDSEVTSAVSTHSGASDPHGDRAASQPVDSDLTAIAALTTTSYGRAFLALADAAAARTALSLGTAATHATGDYDAAGAAAAAQSAAIAASQPVDSDLTAIAALTTTAFGRALLALADPADATKFLNGAGAFAVPPGTGLTNPMTTAGDLIVGGASGTPARLAKGADSTVLTVDPTTHLLVWAASGGGPPTGSAGGGLTGTYPNPTVATNANLTGDVTSSGNATTIGAAKVTEAMQVLADNTTQDASSTKHGYVPKSPADATKFLNGAATPAWAVPASVVNAWSSIPPKLSASLNLDWSHMQMTATPGAATRTLVGIAAGPGNAGTITSGDDADGAWQLLTSAATANNEATMYSVTIFRRDWGAMAFGAFKTPSAFAVGVWEAGFSSGALGTAAVPGTHCAIFRYSTAVDGTAFWRTVTNNAGTGTVTATSVAVAVSTVYRWAIRLLPSSVEYYLATGDGALALVDTCSATLPTATTALALITRVLTLENVAKTILWGRYTILTRP